MFQLLSQRNNQLATLLLYPPRNHRVHRRDDRLLSPQVSHLQVRRLLPASSRLCSHPHLHLCIHRVSLQCSRLDHHPHSLLNNLWPTHHLLPRVNLVHYRRQLLLLNLHLSQPSCPRLDHRVVRLLCPQLFQHRSQVHLRLGYLALNQRCNRPASQPKGQPLRLLRSRLSNRHRRHQRSRQQCLLLSPLSTQVVLHPALHHRNQRVGPVNSPSLRPPLNRLCNLRPFLPLNLVPILLLHHQVNHRDSLQRHQRRSPPRSPVGNPSVHQLLNRLPFLPERLLRSQLHNLHRCPLPNPLRSLLLSQAQFLRRILVLIRLANQAVSLRRLQLRSRPDNLLSCPLHPRACNRPCNRPLSQA